MKLEVIGREIRQYKDADASEEAGREVKKDMIILNCVHDPSRKDANVVTGRQCVIIRIYPNNGLFNDIKALDVPCEINAELSRYKGNVYIDDFDLI